jgi:hypothetical protein
MADTFLMALIKQLKAASYHNSSNVVAPLAVLWPDENGEWRDVVPLVQEHLPVLTLGDYDPKNRTGPALWIRCMLAQALPESADVIKDEVPIIYLPGCGRSQLRAVEGCPQDVRPLVYLQHSGVVWNQKNNRDWTISAFLQSDKGGLGIPVEDGKAIAEALQRSVVALCGKTVEELRKNAPIQSRYLNSLLAPDTAGRVLLWMNDPQKARSEMPGGEWTAFAERCREKLGFDPVTDGELRAAELLATLDGEWQSVWNRFAEVPSNYPGVHVLLRQAKGAQSLAAEATGVFPQDNEVEESDLRAALKELENRLPADIAPALAELDKLHAHRRGWVWSKLGQSPLANALLHLVALCKLTKPLGADEPDKIAERYAADGWKTDAACLKALGCVISKEDFGAISGIIHSVYGVWLRDACEGFQQAYLAHPVQSEPVSAGDGTVIVFADALRMDMAHLLKAKLERQGIGCGLGRRFAALPTVTDTAKPALSPVAGLFGSGKELAPSTDTGATVDVSALRRALSSSGYQVLAGDDTGDPTGKAWVEVGGLDDLGHHDGWRLAHRIDAEIDVIAQRVADLMDAGWKKALIVTDHGWLLLPGGLPKNNLPEVDTEVRKGRCARLKPEATVSVPTVPWHWDKDVRIAVAPGHKCFTAGKDYEHGGLSPQECVVPVLTVESTGLQEADVSIESVTWTGLRCKIAVGGDVSDLAADIRMKALDAGSSIANAAKDVKEDGSASLAVDDDSLVGIAAVVVLYRKSTPSKILKQEFVAVGGK